MNKYLQKRLEQAHLDPKIERLIFITAEAMRGESTSDDFDDFMNEDTEDIRKVLGWRDDEKVRALIDGAVEDKELAYTMCSNNRDGFLAEVNFDIPRNMRFKEDGTPLGWTRGGMYRVCWIYADSIGELVEKIIEKDEEEYNSFVKTAKEEKNSE